jgi:DNA-binding NtrC family response regulator
MLPALNLEARRAQPKSSTTLEGIEKQHILAALKRNKGDRRVTAKELGVSRKTLYNKMKAYQSRGPSGIDISE